MMNSKFIGILFGTISLLAATRTLQAKEGMWMPPKIKEREAEMIKMGLKIPVNELYNREGTGLNQAVVLFGGGCTGEFVSAQGLIFTNHHCAYSYIQQLSSKEHNYLDNGFFAKSRAEELPCKGLTVKIVTKVEDVTNYILKNISDTLPTVERNKLIQAQIESLTKAYEKLYKASVDIKPYYDGNEYWASVYETFSDVRMVASPPDGIGKFGADTDNWMWPRQSGDFAVLRVYANDKNQPAAYNEKNKPYQPVKHFAINTSGVKEGDFTMVYGFPGRTTQYLSSFQVNQIENIVDPIRIEARTLRLNAWDKYMRADKGIFLQYASKQASVANGWKKWQGEVLGLSENKVIHIKEDIEQRYRNMVAGSNDPEERILLTKLEANVNGSNPYVAATEFTRETVLSIEAVQQAAIYKNILGLFKSKATQVEIKDSLQKIKVRLEDFYKNYTPKVDQATFEALMPYYLAQNKIVVASEINYLYQVYGNSVTNWSYSLFSNSMIANAEKMYQFLNTATASDSIQLLQDPAFVLYTAAANYHNQVLVPKLKSNLDNIQILNRQYTAAQVKYNPARKALYPDANSTLRIAYGNVTPIAQKEGNFFLTTLDMKIPRHNPELEEFNIPEKLRNLYATKNYGRWATNGTVPINFIATNHTTGGNSGSPVLNAKGELIGINFDRIWQGTMSDIYFDERLCRNIAVDVRYVLFILDKYGDASWLLNEMKLVK